MRGQARRIPAAALRLLLLAWMGLWYGVGRAVGTLTRILVLGCVSFLQGFVDATGWAGVLGWVRDA